MLEAGTELQAGKYRIRELIGNGGFGITYRAVHSMLGTEVVVKEYFPRQIVQRDSRSQSLRVTGDGHLQAAFESGKRTFLNEARFLYGKKHPHIVTVLDVFEENNTAYLVMEYLEGRNLRQEMLAAGGGSKPAALPQPRVVTITTAMVSALEFLHRQNTYHLDIKPANIMACTDGRIVLIDFGAARQGTSVATQSHLFLSLDYAPPELMYERGYGPETDIFELGITLYELLTGTLPPKAIERFAEQDWEPNLPEPWHTRISTAIRLKRDARPKDIRAWWEALPSTNDHTEWADTPEVDSELVPPDTARPQQPEPKPKPPQAAVDTNKKASEPSGVSVPPAVLPQRSTPTPTPVGTRPTPASPQPETIMAEVEAIHATPPRMPPSQPGPNAPRSSSPEAPKLPDMPSSKRNNNVIGAVLAGGVAIVTLVLGAIGMNAAGKREQDQTSLTNLKQLSLGMMMYIQDYDEKFPPLDQYQTVIAPYVKNEKMFIHPASGQPYTANTNLSYVPLAALDMPSEIILLMEPEPDQKEERAIAFADGHVKRYPETTWQSTFKMDDPQWHRHGL